MRIKLIKDIPGYKAGETFFSPIENWHLSFIEKKQTEIGLRDNDLSKYDVKYLLDNGWAEEVKDEIYMEELRSSMGQGWQYNCFDNKGRFELNSVEEYDFFLAYRIVKAVIEKLNGDWRPDEYGGFYLEFHIGSKSFGAETSMNKIYNILPPLRSIASVSTVISRCEPELKVLFNVK